MLIAYYPAASAAEPDPPVINEFVANHYAASGFDDDHEYIEVRGAPNTNYAGHVILAIEGDYAGEPTVRGTIDGLFPVTTTNAAGYWWSGFLPMNSLENGTLTLLLVDEFSGALGQDLDTDDDGHLDTMPWVALLDAIAVSDGSAQDHAYTAVTLPHGFGGSEGLPAPGGASRIPDGAETGAVADWALNDFEGEGLPGFSGALSAAEARNTPGSRNLKPVRLAVVRSGPGAGSVVSAPAGINCGALCVASFSAYDPITLTAAAQNGSTFAGWSAPCGAAGPCSVVPTQPTTITAFFTHSVYALMAGKFGSGSVSSAPAGIACGNDCVHQYTHGASVKLTATPAAGWSFGGWSGACNGAGACNITMDGTKTVTATFTLNRYDLAANRSGNGVVTSNPPGIDCGDHCVALFEHGTAVTLAAAADLGWSFAGWEGACSGRAACNLLMDAAKSVTVTFALNRYMLTVSKDGTGNGIVTSEPPAAINCGSACSAQVTHGTAITLSATAGAGSRFGGWGGACTGTGVCQVTMDGTRTVSASFMLNTYALTVSKTGGGAVTSEPAGIACGSDCTHHYTTSAVVDLVATADLGWTFDGWEGACTGFGLCQVTMDEAKTVTATFTLNHSALTVAKAGSGSGTITSAQGNLTCGLICSTQAAHGAALTLAANADAGSHFEGWSGACTGLDACALTITAATTVSATFMLDPVDAGPRLYLPALRR
jgi:hypothetical protein